MDIKLFQAKWTLNKFKMSELPEIATQLLVSGIDSSSLNIIAGLDEDEDPKEIDRYFHSFIKEIDLKKISERAAALVLAKDICRKIVSEELDPFTGARKIWWEIWNDNTDLKELTSFVVDATDYEEHYPKDPKILESIVTNAKKLIDETKSYNYEN